MPTMTSRIALPAVLLVSTWLSAQTVEIANRGPQVGTTVPAIAGVDQFGRAHTLKSISGPNGAMLVFFRSADW